MQHRLARPQLSDDGAARHVDDLNDIVVGVREIDPDLTAVRARNRKHRLAMNLEAADLAPLAPVDDQHFVMADRRQEEQITGRRPAFEVRHLVNR